MRNAAHCARFDACADDAITVARRLLGQRLVRIHEGERLAGIIVEAEAYLGSEDRAAHTYNGHRSPRNESMYLEGGHAYIYFTYGMHYCMNVVCSSANHGTAVLLRAIEPTEGIETMFAHRASARPGPRKEPDLCSGPARLTQALAIDRTLDGTDLRTSDVLFIERVRKRAIPAGRVSATPRIGIGDVGEWTRKPLRFCLAGNPHLSRPG